MDTVATTSNYATLPDHYTQNYSNSHSESITKREFRLNAIIGHPSDYQDTLEPLLQMAAANAAKDKTEKHNTAILDNRASVG